jgi:hypothetical protein
MKTTDLSDELAGLDALDLSKANVRDAKNFRAIIAAQKGVDDADANLRDVVRKARLAGDSWTVIGAALGVSKQAAQQRFGG